MEKLIYDIKIIPNDISDAKELTMKTHKVSLKYELLFLIILGISSIIFGFKLYYLLFILSLSILIPIVLKIYNKWAIKKNKSYDEKLSSIAYQDDYFQINLDHEKITYGKTTIYYKDILSIIENKNIYLFLSPDSRFIDKRVFLIIPKRDITTPEFENFISKMQLDHLRSK